MPRKARVESETGLFHVMMRDIQSRTCPGDIRLDELGRFVEIYQLKLVS